MNVVRTLLALALAVAVSGCATVGGGGSPIIATENPDLDGTVVLAPKYDVVEVNVTVPDTLRVSEANMFYPIADIVWRGEPRGDRYQQVKKIFEDGFGFGTSGMRSGPRVIVEAEVTRFHALTEKTRITVGGMHSIRFNLTLRDAETGAIIDGPRKVIADVRGAGGAAALEEDRQGRTQRVVIVERLAQVIRSELSAHQPIEGLRPVTRLDSPLLTDGAALR